MFFAAGVNAECRRLRNMYMRNADSMCRICNMCKSEAFMMQ